MMNIFTPVVALSRKHLLAILFALITGFFVVAPQLIFIYNEGSNYKGLYMMQKEAEFFYLARMQDFYDEGRIGNPFLFEHKFYGPQFMQSGGETILAASGKLFDISVPTLNLIHKFLLPAITFLLLYALIFRLTASSAWSIAGGLFFLVGSTWLYANNLAHFFQGDAAFFDGFVYDRPVHPQFDGILTFLYFNLLLSAHRSGKLRWFIALGALLGLSFYTYFYSFTFFLALNFVFALLWFFLRQKTQMWSIVLTTIVGVLIGTPQLFAIYAAAHHPDYPLLAVFQPIEYGHLPQISKNGLLIALLFIIYVFRTKAHQVLGAVRENIFFLGGLLVTTFVVVNQQVLTGMTLFPGHYHHTFNIPIFVIMLVFLSSSVIAQSKNKRNDPLFLVLPWIASIIFIITGAIVQHFSYETLAPQTSKDQRYMPALSWLAEHTPKDSVVMANDALSDLIPVYTSNNDMWSRGAPFYLVPAERARFTPENLLQSTDFLEDIKQYRVNYIIWDRETDPHWAIDRFQLPQLFSSEGLVIYALHQ